MKDGNILVEVRGLCYSYGERQAVRDAAFTILEGEIFGFLGPNGAGKTTTISVFRGSWLIGAAPFVSGTSRSCLPRAWRIAEGSVLCHKK